jgi:predicted dehydrogenase
MSKIRLGMIGVGGMAGSHLRKLTTLDDVDIVALCDIRDEAFAKTLERYPMLEGAAQYKDYKEMIAAEQLDAVHIDTPHTLHYEMVMHALDKGLHVFDEKPMVCTVAHAHEVLKKVEETGKVFVLGYQRHYQAEFLFIKEKIASGEFGAVQFVQGLQGQEWKKGVAGTWRHELKWSGGGQLNDSGSHLLAVLLFATGLAVDQVGAFIDNLGMEVDINSALNLKFDNGAQGNVSVVGNAPAWYEDITIWCENGAFYMRNGKLEIQDATGKRTPATEEDLPKGSTPDDNFINAIMGREPVGSPPIWGLRVIELTEAAWASAAKGGVPVKVERTAV